MQEPDPKDFLSDLLSPLTRTERRNLLLASVSGLLTMHAGLVPNSISALGIEFSVPEQRHFLMIVACVIMYFLFAFLLYAIADFFVWRKKRYDYDVYVELQGREMTQEEQERHDDLRDAVPPINWYYQKSHRLANCLAIFDYLIPLILGIYAVAALILRATRTA